MPSVGVRGTELVGVGICFFVAGLAYVQQIEDSLVESTSVRPTIPMSVLGLMGVVGLVSMSLEVIWARLEPLLIGGSVYAFAIVLSVFLVGIALGAMCTWAPNG